jgi:hypothetical protein
LHKLNRFRPSPALVISVIALFVALGGVGYAAATIGTQDIKNGAVTSKKLHRAAVASKKIRKGAVRGAKVKDNSLGGLDINESSLGVVPNANHASTADNASNASNADQLGNVTVQRTDFTVANGTDNGVTVTCAPGQQALAGGVRNDNADTDGYVEISRPVSDATEGPTDGQTFDGWRAFVYNQTDAQSGQTFGANTLQASAWVICAG